VIVKWKPASKRMPSVERVCRRMLQRDLRMPVALVVFDVLELDGEPTIRLSYRRRRELLESLDFAGRCELCPRFDDGSALWPAVREHRLEASSRTTRPALPTRRANLDQAENPEWPRYQAEREAVIRERRDRRR
jgi:hypothetical protein